MPRCSRSASRLMHATQLPSYIEHLKASAESIPEETVHPQLIELDIEEAVYRTLSD